MQKARSRNDARMSEKRPAQIRDGDGGKERKFCPRLNVHRPGQSPATTTRAPHTFLPAAPSSHQRGAFSLTASMLSLLRGLSQEAQL